MKNYISSLKRKLCIAIIKKHAWNLRIEPDERHNGMKSAYFQIDDKYGFLLRLLDPDIYSILESK